jgi:hypothetical protein
MNNERSLAKEITEGFEALKSMRNNEPVAWMSNGKEFYVQKNYCPDFIPLYTYPVKELTDEEIKSEAKYLCHGWHSENPERLVLFAKAILRKAQEK